MTFSLDSLAMEAAHAALALADSANTGVVGDPWGAAPPQMPFNYAWGRAAAASAQTAVVAAATDAAALNDTLEAARRGRGRPKKEAADGVGAEARSSNESNSKKPPPIRGRGRPPRAAETNDPSASSSIYDKFPLPPGLHSSGWPPSAPPYLRLTSESSTSSQQQPPPPSSGVDLTRETPSSTAAPSSRSGGGGTSHYAGECHAGASGVGTNACCPSTVPTSPCSENGNHQHHHHHHQHHPGGSGNHALNNSNRHGQGNVDSKDSVSAAATPSTHHENSTTKLHPTYPPFSVHAPGPTCFPGKQMFMINSPIASPPPPSANSNPPPLFKHSPSHAGGSGGGSASQHHQKNNSSKQANSSSENSGTSCNSLAVIPRPIMLGGTNVGCPICFKIFGSKGLLSQHMLVHTDVRKHACLYCDKSFKQQSHLKAHVRIHTGERPYKCTMPDCGRDFVQMANLQFHLRNHEAQRRRATEEKTGHRERVRCPICYKGFDSGLGLERHMFDFHEPAVIDQELSLSNSNSSN